MINPFIAALILVLIGPSMLYPAFFTKLDRLHRSGAISKKSIRVNYLVHLLAGGICVFLLWIFKANLTLQISGAVYFIMILTVVLYYWFVPISKWNLFIASILFGFIVFIRTIQGIVQLMPLWPGVIIGTISAAVLSIATIIFTLDLMNKECFQYSKIKILIKILVGLLLARIVWDFVVLFFIKIGDQNGVLMSTLQFLLNNAMADFIFVLIFGLLIPLMIGIIILYFSNKIKANFNLILSAGAFGCLWVAEFIYKYLLLQYGIVL